MEYLHGHQHKNLINTIWLIFFSTLYFILSLQELEWDYSKHISLPEIWMPFLYFPTRKIQQYLLHFSTVKLPECSAIRKPITSQCKYANLFICHTVSLLLAHLLNPLKPELNPICYLLALLGAHHFFHVSRIRVKLLTLRWLMSYIYGEPILDVSRSHTTTQHSR